jgi:hypothetical protein
MVGGHLPLGGVRIGGVADGPKCPCRADRRDSQVDRGIALQPARLCARSTARFTADHAAKERSRELHKFNWVISSVLPEDSQYLVGWRTPHELTDQATSSYATSRWDNAGAADLLPLWTAPAVKTSGSGRCPLRGTRTIVPRRTRTFDTPR